MITRIYRATCDECGRTADVVSASHQADAKKVLRANGWTFGGVQRCRGCAVTYCRGPRRSAEES